MALGERFRRLGRKLADFVIRKEMDGPPHRLPLARKDWQSHKKTYGETYQHLITTRMEAHSAFHARYNAQCTKNPLARGFQIMDKSVVVEPNLLRVATLDMQCLNWETIDAM